MPIKTMILFCLLVSETCCTTWLYGQEGIITFERFDESKGLPNNLFKQVIQDRQGLLWMTGADGMARYDGHTFKEYRHNKADSNSISGNNLLAIFEDSKGRIWISTLGAGVNVSDRRKEKFQRIKVYEHDESSFLVNDFSEDKNGRIWLASNKGLIILQEENEIFKRIDHSTLWKNNPSCHDIGSSSCLRNDQKGNMWIGSGKGLYMYDVENNVLKCPEDFQGLPQTNIHKIVFDRNSKLWVCCENTGTRLYYANESRDKFYPFNKIPIQSAARETRFAFDLDNQLWVSVFNEQVYAYDFRDSSLFLQSKLNSNMNLERFMRDPFIDHSGNVWLSGEGFYIYRYPKGFNHIQHSFAFHQSSTSIFGSDSILWLAYREKGMIRLNPQNGEAIYYSAEATGNEKIPVNHIQRILPLNNGNKLIIGFSQIAIMNKEDRVFKFHPIGGTNRAALQDSKGRIWIGSYKGLHLFTEDEGVIRTYSLTPAGKDSVDLIQTIVEDKRGFIWFGSDSKGLNRLDPETELIDRFNPNSGTNSIPTVSVVDMVMDANQQLWLGTDIALIRFDPVTYAIKVYDKNAGLENDYICAVLSDHKGMIWVSTHAGISSFDPVKEEFVNYGIRDGLKNAGYYRRNKFLADDGLIYFGGKNGVDFFYPDRLRDNPTPPKMYLSGIKIDHHSPFSSLDIAESGEVKLTPSNTLIEIEFIGLHYAAQQDVQYRYKIDGLNEDWIDLGTEHKILLTHLKPGDYVFHAVAKTPDNISSDELTIPIRVIPPFYSTLWFRILSAASLLGLIIGYFRYRENSIKRKDKRDADINRKINELEKRALQAQMNPHFIYNSMNSIQQFIIVHDVEGAMKYLTKFSRILRTVLNMSAENRIPLVDEIKLIEDYLELENMRFPDKFDYEIKVSDDLNIHAIEIPPFFIQPQVENAIIHGLLKKSTPGHLLVDIRKEGEHMRIVVEDNGIGRKAALEAKSRRGHIEPSKGLAIMEERLKHLNPQNGFQAVTITDLHNGTGEPIGTRVEIILPIDG